MTEIERILLQAKEKSRINDLQKRKRKIPTPNQVWAQCGVEQQEESPREKIVPITAPPGFVCEKAREWVQTMEAWQKAMQERYVVAFCEQRISEGGSVESVKRVLRILGYPKNEADRIILQALILSLNKH